MTDFTTDHVGPQSSIRRRATGHVCAAAAMFVTLALSACTTSSSSIPRADVGEPLPQLQPVETGSVREGNLPPVGADGQPVGVAGQPGGVAGQPGLPGQTLSTQPDDGLGQSQDPLLASRDPSFVTLDDFGAGDSASSVGGELSIEDLLGGWTIQDSLSSCRLNLTYTAKGETGRYRASAPGCDVSGVAAVSSWQLAGNQVQLFSEAGQLIGSLAPSGERFVGTMTGGLGVSMER